MEWYPEGAWSGEHGRVSFSWEYQTTADILTIREIYPDGTTREALFGPERANAYRDMFNDWHRSYYGK